MSAINAQLGPRSPKTKQASATAGPNASGRSTTNMQADSGHPFHRVTAGVMEDTLQVSADSNRLTN